MIDIDIDTSGIEGLFDRFRDSDEARQYMGERFVEYMTPYVPYRTGELCDSASVDPHGITYSAPHAARVYYGDDIEFRKDIHPLATSRWDVAAASAHMQDLERDMLEYFTEGR